MQEAGVHGRAFGVDQMRPKFVFARRQSDTSLLAGFDPHQIFKTRSPALAGGRGRAGS